MIIFSLDLHPEDGYLNNKIEAACTKRNKELFKEKYKIFTPEDKIVQDAYDFFGKDLINNRPYKSMETDLVRCYILWKLPEAWYVDADVYFLNAKDINKVLGKVGGIKSGNCLYSASNGGIEKGMQFWGEIAKKIKEDLIKNGDHAKKFDFYFCDKFNIPDNYISEEYINIFHFEKYLLFRRDHNIKVGDQTFSRIIFYEKTNRLKSSGLREGIFFAITNPDPYTFYCGLDTIPVVDGIWKSIEEFQEFANEEAKYYKKDAIVKHSILKS